MPPPSSSLDPRLHGSPGTVPSHGAPPHPELCLDGLYLFLSHFLQQSPPTQLFPDPTSCPCPAHRSRGLSKLQLGTVTPGTRILGPWGQQNLNP